METYVPAIPASQPATMPSSSGELELAAIFQLASQTCEAMIAAYAALEEAYKAMNDTRMDIARHSPRAAFELCSTSKTLKHSRATLASPVIQKPSSYKELTIPTLLPVAPPVHSTPSATDFSPLPAYAHIAIIITDYEPHAQACWDIGALNEFRAAKRGGKEGKEVGLWRDWRPGGLIACWSCLGDGEDRGAFAGVKDREGKADDEADDEEGNEEGEEEEEGESSDDYDSDTDSDEYDSDDVDSDDYEDIGVDIVFG
jgi:hypothetical protein